MDKKEKQKSTTKQTATKTRNKPVIILLALLLVTAIAFSMYAYAKYKTTLTGNGTATVAKWSFKVNGQTQTIPDIDLATTMKKVNNVAENKLAPGTEGSFDLNLDATGSEVAIDYNIKLAITEKPSNLRFYTDSSYTKEIASTDGVMNVSGVMSLEEVKTIQTKTIYWKWAYQTGTAANDIVANDKIDTADSKKSVTMTITVTGTQRNPSQGEVTAIDELQVGDVINYNPSGTYSWDRNYATSNSTATDTLSSSTGQSFNVSKWKVLGIDKKNGKIEMVPATTPSGTVTLQGAQGYNNAVKLLNDACSSLYSDTSKGITARSIAEEDFVKVGGTKWINKRAAHSNAARYGNQYETPYTTYNYYPVMYKNEANHVIDGTKTESGLKQSEQTSLIAKTDESSTNGYLKATKSIQPYQTYYSTTDYATTASLLEGYSSILLPKGSSTTYWVASRCVNLYSSSCGFSVRIVYSGYFGASGVFYSGTGVDSTSRAVFPVVSLSSQLLEKAANGTYNVK
mgnify:CR=1 FL=1